MRILLKVNIPVKSGNAAAKAGKLGSTIQSILADLKPEAVYFTDDNGQRTGFLFLDLSDASQIPAIAEPWMLAFNVEHRASPGHDARRPGQGRTSYRKGGQKVRLNLPALITPQSLSAQTVSTCAKPAS